MGGALGPHIQAQVAPFTGAWIEIFETIMALLRLTVAPFTGAWIEILRLSPPCSDGIGRALHGRVD